MTKKEKIVVDLHEEIVNRKEEIIEMENALEEAKYNCLLSSFTVLKTLLADGEIIDCSKDSFFVEGYMVNEIKRNKDDIVVGIMGRTRDGKTQLSSTDVSDHDLLNIAAYIIHKTADDIIFDDFDEDDDDDEFDDDDIEFDDDDNVEPSVKTFHLPMFANNTEVNEDVFWATVNTINWENLSKMENSVAEAKRIIVNMGFSVKQIKELRDIFAKLQNELVNAIKMEYSDKEFSKSDSKIIEISDYIISLGDEAYVNVFTGMEDILPYTSPHSISFIQCFS